MAASSFRITIYLTPWFWYPHFSSHGQVELVSVTACTGKPCCPAGILAQEDLSQFCHCLAPRLWANDIISISRFQFALISQLYLLWERYLYHSLWCRDTSLKWYAWCWCCNFSIKKPEQQNKMPVSHSFTERVSGCLSPCFVLLNTGRYLPLTSVRAGPNSNKYQSLLIMIQNLKYNTKKEKCYLNFLFSIFIFSCDFLFFPFHLYLN